MRAEQARKKTTPEVAALPHGLVDGPAGPRTYFCVSRPWTRGLLADVLVGRGRWIPQRLRASPPLAAAPPPSMGAKIKIFSSCSGFWSPGFVVGAANRRRGIGIGKGEGAGKG